MSTELTVHPANAAGIRALRPVQQCRTERCEIRLNVGLFFDGTGNNARWVEPGTSGNQEARRKDSNVFRLWTAYPEAPAAGDFRFYVPGVGTPFPEIGEHESAARGMGFGAGGEGRIVFGLLQVLNAMHRSVDPRDRPIFSPAVVEALCSFGHDPHMPARHRQVLRPLGMESGGLLSDWPSGLGARRVFLLRQGALLAAKIAAANKPKLVEVFVDVFGFSRGAAEARVFCHWLDELFQGNQLFGVRAHIRFVGLFDTVASVGLPTSASAFTDGHMGWGDAPYLVIPRRVGHCEHYIAAHENRGSFPSDTVGTPGGLPGNCREYVFPGMHSDVGGGYTPQEQGRGPTADNAEKLSQLPLNHMYGAACAAHVPLDKTRAVQGTYDPYQIAPGLQAAYDGWRAESGGSKPLREWLLPYLSWRYQMRERYTRLPAFQRAPAQDRDDLAGANATLLADIQALENPPSEGTRLAESVLGGIAGFGILARRVIARSYDKLAPEAPAVLQQVKAAAPTSPVVATLFADYVHDSFAGFRPFDTPILGADLHPESWEPEGYLRWRVHYRGNDTRLTRRQQQEAESQVA